MNDIPIEYGAPIIFTKDAAWPESSPRFEEGAVIILPSDAVLVWPKETRAVQLATPKEDKSQED